MKWLLAGDDARFSYSTSLSENKEGLVVSVVLTGVCIVTLLKSAMFVLVSLTLYTQLIFTLNSRGFTSTRVLAMLKFAARDVVGMIGFNS